MPQRRSTSNTSTPRARYFARKAAKVFVMSSRRSTWMSRKVEDKNTRTDRWSSSSDAEFARATIGSGSAAQAARRAAVLLGGLSQPLSPSEIQSLRERFTNE
jgi:hypothetical protein